MLYLHSDLWFLPGKSLKFSIVIEDGELNCLPARVEAHSKLRLASGVGDPDQLPPVLSWPPVPEGGHKTELLWQPLIEHSPAINNIIHTSSGDLYYYRVGMMRLAVESIL